MEELNNRLTPFLFCPHVTFLQTLRGNSAEQIKFKTGVENEGN